MLTPMDIHDHQFKKSFRGYNENEVDDFLDRIVADFEKLLRDNERLKNQVHTNEKELEHYRKFEKNLNETLMMAQRTADEVISTARKNADDMKEQAARDCQLIREQARFEAKQEIDGAKVKRDAILSEYDKFVREKNAFLMKLRTILESELSITTQMLEDMPSVAESVKQILPEEPPAPVEVPVKPAEPVTPAEPEKVPEPVKPVEPVKKVPEPVKPVEPVKKIPVPEDTIELPNIIDVSTKPVTTERIADETKTYKPVLVKGAAK